MIHDSGSIGELWLEKSSFAAFDFSHSLLTTLPFRDF